MTGQTLPLRLAASVCAILLGMTTLHAQTPRDSATGANTLDSLLRVHSHAVSQRGGTFTGPGVEFLLGQLRDAQFVALGERHGIAEIPQFAGWLLDTLARRHGFRFLAAENGPATLEVLRRKGATRRHDSLQAFVRRYPNALEFGGDEDLALYARAGGRLEPLGGGLWFLDQEFGALHLLESLRGRPGVTGERARLLDSLMSTMRVDESKAIDVGRHWMGVASQPTPFARAASQFAAAGDTAGASVLRMLAESARLYDLNRRAGAGEPTGFDANNDREELMKRTFSAFYRRAARTQLPRAIVKLGSAHLNRGQGPFGPFTVGNLLSELAIANGLRSYHVMVLAHNARADSLAPSLWGWAAMRPIALAAPTTSAVLIDLRPLRAYAYAGRLGPLLPDLRRTIYGYDAMLVLGGAHEGREDIMHGRR
ncbi:MAG: hypothetical protein HOP28_16565 [Gemmatimonadales bacterium]|nr:hypothetical protein [Gemmatimonadales bacterium]